MKRGKFVWGEAAAFFDGDDLIGGYVVKFFASAAGPEDFDGVDAIVDAQAEVDSRILGRAVAHAAFGLIIAGEIGSDDFQSSAGGVAIAFGPDEADGEPMIFRGGG